MTVADEAFFPPGAVSPIEQDCYGRHLSAMREPVLKPNQTDDTTFAFRIMYLPTWGHPVSVRYWSNGTNYFRRRVMLSGSGGYDPGVIKKESQIEVDKQEIDQVLASLEKIQFWKLATKDNVSGLDGSQLVLEGIRREKYKLVVRWTPEHESNARGLKATVDFYRELFDRVGLVDSSEVTKSDQTK